MKIFWLYFHTVRHLKIIQIFYQIKYRLFRQATPKRDIVPKRGVKRKFVAFVEPPQTLLTSDTFCFLNQKGSLREIGWNGKKFEKLWRYNQHYFQDLNAVNASNRVSWHSALLNNWMEANPIGEGVGWEIYPTSLRIVNWIKWSFSGNDLSDDWQQSLATQTRWVFQRLEYHILGNHLFANAKALVFSGLFFEGNEASKWLESGLSIIEKELNEQVLDDGGHFELSPMYQCIFLEDILDLINICEHHPSIISKVVISCWRQAAEKMLYWLGLMTHPDGEVAFFNDAAIGFAANYCVLREYAVRLNLNSKPSDKNRKINMLNDTGYIRINCGNATALLDVAQIGPRYLSGHAHADTLSFELSVFRQRIIVNTGTSEYGNGPIRLYERGTAAHNTVIIDNCNSSEVWQSFRVARRGSPRSLSLMEKENCVEIECSHDGYKRLAGRPVHKRIWEFNDGFMRISDSIEGKFKSATANYFFHPDLEITIESFNKMKILLPNGDFLLLSVEHGHPEINKAHYSPEFGMRIPNQCLQIRLDELKRATLSISGRL